MRAVEKCLVLIYCIENTFDGKKYVGKTTWPIDERLREHIQDARKRCEEKRPLYRAINKYGADKFIITELEIRESANGKRKNACGYSMAALQR